MDSGLLSAAGLTVRVETLSPGSAIPDELVLNVTDFGSGSNNILTAQLTIPIYVLPMVDLPTLNNLSSSSSTTLISGSSDANAYTIELSEDTSIALSGLVYFNLDDSPKNYNYGSSSSSSTFKGTYSLDIRSPYAVIDFIALNASAYNHPNVTIQFSCNGKSVANYSSGGGGDDDNLYSNSSTTSSIGYKDICLSSSSTSTSDLNQVSMKGSLPALNQLIASIVYIPIPNYFGNTSLVFSLSISSHGIDNDDGENDTLQLTRRDRIYVLVSPVADPPSVKLASLSTAVISGRASSLPSIQVSDVDSELFSSSSSFNSIKVNNNVIVTYESPIVTLAVTCGVLFVPVLREVLPGDFRPVSWSSGSFFQLSGTVEAINTVLEFIQYQHESSYDRCLLSVSIISSSSSSSRDGPSRYAEGSMTIRVISEYAATSELVINTPMYNNDAVVIIEEDSAWTASSSSSSSSLYVSSHNRSYVSADLLEIILTCETGTLLVTLSDQDQVSTTTTPSLSINSIISSSSSSTSSSSSGSSSNIEILSTGKILHLRANSVTAINSALASVRYIPPNNFFGSSLISISLMVDPHSSRPRVSTASLLFVVTSVDDPTVITINSSSPLLAPQQPISDSTMLQQLFQVTDYDDIFLMNITLQAMYGAFNLSNEVLADPSIPIYVLHDSLGVDHHPHSLSFMADNDNVTYILQSIIYSPPSFFKGMDIITLTVTSQALNTSSTAASLPERSSIGMHLQPIPGSSSSSPLYIPISTTTSEVIISVSTPSLMTLDCVSSVTALEDESFQLGSICSLLVQIASTIAPPTPYQLLLENAVDINTIIITVSVTTGSISLLPWLSEHHDNDWYTVLNSTSIIDSNGSSLQSYTDLSAQMAVRYVTEFLLIMSYRGFADYNGDAEITISAVYQCSTAGTYIHVEPVSTELPVHILPVNDYPVITIDDDDMSTVVTTISSSQSLVIRSLTISDVDFSTTYNSNSSLHSIGWLDVTFSADHGSMSVNHSFFGNMNTGVFIADDGAESGIVHLLSTDVLLTSFIQSGAVYYVYNNNYPGNNNNNTQSIYSVSDSILIHVTDNGFYGAHPNANYRGRSVDYRGRSVDSDYYLSANRSIAVTVIIDIIAVSIAISPRIIVGIEDQPIALYGNLTIHHGTYSVDDVITVTLSSPLGSFSVDEELFLPLIIISSSSIGDDDDDTDDATMLSIEGTISDVRKVLPKIIFYPSQDTCMYVAVEVILYHHRQDTTSPLRFDMFLHPMNDQPMLIISTSSSSHSIDVDQDAVISFKNDSSRSSSSSSSSSVNNYISIQAYDVDLTIDPFQLYNNQVSVLVSTDCGALQTTQSTYQLIQTERSSSVQVLGIDRISYSADVCPEHGSSSTSSSYASSSSSSALPMTAYDRGFHSINITGSIDSVNAVLHSLLYTAPSDYFGTTSIEVTMSDLGNYGSQASSSSSISISIPLTTVASIPINIHHVPKAPRVYFPSGDVELPLNAPSFTGSQTSVLLVDRDASRNDLYTLRISTDSLTSSSSSPPHHHHHQSLDYQIHSYIIRVVVPTAYDQFVTSIDPQQSSSATATDEMVSLLGTLGDLSTIVPDLLFTIPEYFHGLISLSFTMTEQSTTEQLSSTGTVFVKVPFVNHSPVLLLNQTSIDDGMDEDSPMPMMPYFSIYDGDVSFLSDVSSPVYLKAPDACCFIAFNATCIHCYFLNNTNTSSLATSFRVVDTPSMINHYISQLSILPLPDYHGDISVVTSMIDYSNNIHITDLPVVANQLLINVRPVNDPPSIHLLPSLSTLTLPENGRKIVTSYKDDDALPSSRNMFGIDNINSSQALSQRGFVHVNDVDALSTEKFQLQISCLQCNLSVVLDESSSSQRIRIISEHSFSSSSSSSSQQTESDQHMMVITGTASPLIVEGFLTDLNHMLKGLMYVPYQYYSGHDIISFQAIDSHSASSQTFYLPVYVFAVNNPPTISVDINPLPTILEGSILNVTGITVKDPDFDASSSHANLKLEALVSVSHGGVLEVQSVTTKAMHVDPVQSVSIFASPYHKIIGGSFRLSLDLSSYGLASYQTGPIAYDAIGMRWAELANSSSSSMAQQMGQSMEAIITDSIKVLRDIGVTVSVSLLVDDGSSFGPDGNPNYIPVSSLSSTVGVLGGRQWRVTFINGHFDFPLLQVVSNDLIVDGGSKATTSIDVVHPGNALGGSFQLLFGDEATAAIPFDASDQMVASALEALPSVHAVGVSRYPYDQSPTRLINGTLGMEHGYTWLVTFYVAEQTMGGDVPQMTANYTLLTGSLLMTDPSDYQNTLLSAVVEIDTVVDGVGHPRVLVLSSSASHVDEVVEIQMVSNKTASSTGDPSVGLEFFFISVVDPTTQTTARLGPVFADTVAMIADEMKGDAYPLHAQPSGTGKGESMQSMLQALPFFTAFTEDVSVSKVTVSFGSDHLVTIMTWTITFIHANYHSWSYVPIPDRASNDTDTATLSIHSRVNIKTIRHPNRIGGSFQLSFSGQLSSVLPVDCSSDQLTAALMQLYDIYDPVLKLGSVVTSRRSVSLEGAYTWYIAILQDIDFASRLAPQEVVITTGLTGNGSYMSLHIIRERSLKYGLKLSTPNSGIANGSRRDYKRFVTNGYELATTTTTSSSTTTTTTSTTTTATSSTTTTTTSGKGVVGGGAAASSLYDWQETMILLGTPDQLTAALNNLQYRPAPHWSGEMKIIIRVTDKTALNVSDASQLQAMASYNSSYYTVTAVVEGVVQPVNNPSQILWKTQVINGNAFVEVRLFEDTDVRLGGEVVYSSITSHPINDQMTTSSSSSSSIHHSPVSNITASGFYYTSSTASDDYNDDAVMVGSQALSEPHRSINRLGLQISDVDIDGNDLIVTLSVTNGYLSVLGVAPLRGAITSKIVDVSRWSIDLQPLSPGNTISDGESLILKGSLFDINKQLDTLRYQSPLHANGYDYIKVVVSDGETVDSMGGVDSSRSVSEATLAINIAPVNDFPVIYLNGTSVGTLYTDGTTWETGVIRSLEDSPLAIGQYFSIYDPDFDVKNYIGDAFMDPRASLSFQNDSFEGQDNIYVSLSVTNGLLSFPIISSVIFLKDSNQLTTLLQSGYFQSKSSSSSSSLYGRSNPRSNSNGGGGGASEVYLYGSYFHVQQLLQSTIYTPNTDWFGVDLFTITINDLGNIGTGGPLSLTRHMLIEVECVEDPPMLLLPPLEAMLDTVEDTVGVIGSDCCNWLDSSSDYGSSVVNISATSIQIVDRDLHLNLRSERAIVRSTKNFINPETNDPKFNITYISPSTQDLFQYEYDSNEHIPVINNFTVTLRVGHGVLTLPRLPATVALLHGSGFQDDLIIMTGELIELNIALRGINYLPDRNWNSIQGGKVAARHGISTVEVLQVLVVDGSGLNDSAQIHIFVKPANDPPVITLGSVALYNTMDHEVDELSRTILRVNTLQCIENESCPLQDLVARDVDVKESPNGVLLLIFSSSHGTLQVDRSQGDAIGYFFHSGSKLVSIYIPATEIYTSLQGLKYMPDVDYYGPDELIITVDDLGNTGYGPLCAKELELQRLPCSLKSNITIPIYVSPLPDRIEIITPKDIITGDEDSMIVISGLSFINHQHLSLQSLQYLMQKNSFGNTFDDEGGGEGEGALLVNITHPFRKVFHVRLVTSDGSLKFTETPLKLNFSIGDGNSLSSEIAFNGPLYLINKAVEKLQFLPSIHLNILNHQQLASISVTITDTIDSSEKITMLPQVVTATSILKVRVLPVDDGPVVHVPGETYYDLDTEVTTSSPTTSTTTTTTTNSRGGTGVDRVAVVLIDEDGEYQLDKVFISDVDIDEYKFSLVQVNITAQHGTFSSYNYSTKQYIRPIYYYNRDIDNIDIIDPNVIGSTVQKQGYYGVETISRGYQSIMLQGSSVSHINDYIRNVIYSPNLNYFGSDGIIITARTKCLSSSSSSSSSSSIDPSIQQQQQQQQQHYFNISYSDCNSIDTQTIPIHMRSVNDAPVWIVPRVPLIVKEDIAYPFANSVSIVDVDSGEGLLAVHINVVLGQVTLPFIPHAVELLNCTGTNDEVVIMVGTLFDLNIALSNMIFIPPRNWNTQKNGVPSSLHLVVNDLGHSFDAYQRMNLYNVSYLVHLSGDGDSGDDDDDASSDQFTAVADVMLLVVPDIGHTPFVSLPGAQLAQYPCVSQDGQLGEIQEVAETPREQQCDRIISVDVLHVLEDEKTQIKNISVGDADEKDRIYRLNYYLIRLTTNHGRISVQAPFKYGVEIKSSQSSSSSSSGGGGGGGGGGEGNFHTGTVGDTALTIVGLLGNLNLLLSSGLFYHPPPNYYGPDYLSVYVNDQAYSESMGKSSNETLPIYVDAVNDAPVMNVRVRDSITNEYTTVTGNAGTRTEPLVVLEDHRLAIVGLNISDPDYIEFSATRPTYSRGGFDNGDGDGDDDDGVDSTYPFTKQYNTWQLQKYREQQATGLLRLHVRVSHGRVMFASTTSINFLNVPNATEESIRLGLYPNSDGSFDDRNVYTGVDGIVDEDVRDGTYTDSKTEDSLGGGRSGAPRQLWWKEVLMEGRLFDLNRALSMVTYWPDLNWNSGSYLIYHHASSYIIIHHHAPPIIMHHNHVLSSIVHSIITSIASTILYY